MNSHNKVNYKEILKNCIIFIYIGVTYMLNKSIDLKLFIGLMVLMIIINLICYHLLPSNVMVQFNGSGTADGSMSKILYTLFSPLFIIAVYAIQKFIKQTTLIINLGASLFLFLINIVILYINIR
jgi:uncharacterized membrane protein